ncbi:HWE histidine kinase domain-containing protein [Phenylobacterium sp.]|jgi:PAS domain S-box-containing protein|uniref:HWE histidine kinase domain-containing protein n=1 Tax=Phenylobacterium sp. TaxID=1871053 RepID=UPI002F408166
MSDEPDRRKWDPQRLSESLRAAGLGEFDWDFVRDVIRMSALTAEITGASQGERPAQGGEMLRAMLHPDDRDTAPAAVEVQLQSADHYAVECRCVRPDDGRMVWVRITGQRVRDDAGAPIAAAGLVQDITARKDEDDRRVTLMAELDHRVKNVLATVQALAAQTAKRTTSLDNFLQTFSGRLKAMASANELLTAARWRGASVEHLASAELGALAPGQTRWGGPELFLTPRAANALSLALHELATNALKFGALSTDTGRIDLRWSRLVDGGFELVWTESNGPPVTAPAHRGFGSTLLEQVTGRELNGETRVEYRAAGVQALLRAGPAALVERPETMPEAPPKRVVETVTASGGPAELNGARVLIVEDAVLLALELETGLSDAGAVVIGPAYELEEAMGLLDQPIDAAVLDANLNGRSVIPVAKVLAERGVPFVFATGYGEAGGPPIGFDAPIIRKPYDVTQVAAAVAALLQAR